MKKGRGYPSALQALLLLWQFGGGTVNVRLRWLFWNTGLDYRCFLFNNGLGCGRAGLSVLLHRGLTGEGGGIFYLGIRILLVRWVASSEGEASSEDQASGGETGELLHGDVLFLQSGKWLKV